LNNQIETINQILSILNKLILDTTQHTNFWIFLVLYQPCFMLLIILVLYIVSSPTHPKTTT